MYATAYSAPICILIFYNRHKMVYVLVQIMNENILLDEAELDDTFLTYEQEGYVKQGKKGISEDKIEIACCY